MMKHSILCIILALQLTACATATRGTTTFLVVNTVPTGAKVITSKETLESQKIGTSIRKTALETGVETDLEFKYMGCNPTPCGIEVPRKSKLEILVTKEGYEPQIFFIDRIHRKDVAKNNSKKAALSTGAAAGAGAATALATGATIGGASIAAPLAIMAALPIAVVGGTSIIVDAASGANFDLTPNPVNVTFLKTEITTNTQEELEALVTGFHKRRRDLSLGITIVEQKSKKVEMCTVSQAKTVPCETLNKEKGVN